MNKLITLEGTEGVGKSTAMSFLHEFLTARDIDFIVTREPGGTPIAETIRRALLAKFDEPMTAKTELLLFFAARVQHVERVIKPALAAGKTVICDRYVDASYAYQGGGRALGLDYVAKLDALVDLGVTVDATLLLDAPVDVGLARVEQNREHKDRIEEERASFFERVRAAYLQRAQAEPARFHLIDASQSIDSVRQQLAQALEKVIVAF